MCRWTCEGWADFSRWVGQRITAAATDTHLALAGLPFSFRTVNLKIGVQKHARIPGDQSLGSCAVIAAPRTDDPAVERDP